MLTSFELTLQPSQPLLQANRQAHRHRMGSYGHAMFLAWVAQRDPDLFEELHAPSLPYRPYSLQWLSPNTAGQTWQWRITALSPPMASWLHQHLQAKPPTFALDDLGLTLTTTNVKIVHEQSAISLVQQAFATVAVEGSVTYRLQFSSPTSFKQAASKQFYPLPNPRLLLQGGLARWNTFNPHHRFDDPDLLPQLCQSLVFKRYQLSGLEVGVDQGRIPAFVGWVELRQSPQAHLKPLVHLLFSYQQWAGFGAKTAMGMGNCTVSLRLPTPHRPRTPQPSELPRHEQPQPTA
jgi:CRISPR-associated endoribonuclease Cas6